MKFINIFLLFLFSIQVYSQNYIFENEKENNLISFFQNTKIEFFNDKIKLIENEKEYVFEFYDKNNQKLILKKTTPFDLNYYLDTFKVENLKSYLSVNYGDVKISLENNIHFEVDENSKVFLNSKPYIENISHLITIKKNQKNTLLRDDKFNYKTVFSSFIGLGNSISGSSSIDEGGNLYFSGFSSSNLENWIKYAYQSNIKGDQDCFVVKFNQDNEVVWGTYVGSTGKDGSCYLDTRFGMVWVAGETHSSGFPVTNDAISNKYYSDGDVVVFRLNYNGQFEYGTYNGGSRYDTAIDVKIDDEGIAWIAGRFYSSDNFYFTDNAENKLHLGLDDGFLMAFDKNRCIYSSRIGGNGYDLIESMCITDKYIVLGGYSTSNDLKNIIEDGKSPAYLTAINKKSLQTEWSIRFDGDGNDAIQSLHSISNESDEFYVSGYTNNNFLAFGDVFQNYKKKGTDFYIRKYKENGTLLKSTYLGGDENEGNTIVTSFQGGGISNDLLGNIYVSGQTNSENFPTTENVLQQTKNGKFDTFLSIFDSELKDLKYSTYIGGSNDETGRDILYYNNSIYLNGWTRSNDFPISENAIQKNSAGPYTGYILKLQIVDTTQKPCNDNYIEYTDFHNKNGLRLVQHAVTYDSTLRLTKADFYQKGAVWIENPLDVSKGFSSEFTFELSEGDDNQQDDGFLEGADGLAFIIQGVSNDVIGIAGGGIGYDNLKNALAIELDLYYNDETNYNDPNGNHIALFSSKSNIVSDHKSNQLKAENIHIDEIQIDKRRYKFKVVYNSEDNSLNVFLNENDKSEKLVLTLNNFDINDHIDLINNQAAYIGVSAATGNAVQRHELFSFVFCGGDEITSVDYELESNNLIYPNPTNSFIYVNRSEINSNIEIYDMLGNKMDFIQNQNKLDVSNFKSGIYLIKFESENNTNYQKFVVE